MTDDHLKQAHAIMLRRIVDETADDDGLFAAAIQTLVDETSMHAVIEALFQIARTRQWTVSAAPHRELGQALELTMNIAERSLL